MEEPKFTTEVCEDPQPFKEPGSKQGQRRLTKAGIIAYRANKFWNKPVKAR